MAAPGHAVASRSFSGLGWDLGVGFRPLGLSNRLRADLELCIRFARRRLGKGRNMGCGLGDP